MENTQHSKSTSRLASLRGLGRGIAATSLVAVMGVGTMSAADAAAAGVAHGVRHAGSSVQNAVKPSPTTLPTQPAKQLVVRDGKISEL